MDKKEEWRKLGECLYSNHHQTTNLQLKDFCISDNKSAKDRMKAEEDLQKFKNITNPDEREKWFYKRMLENAAIKRNDLLLVQNIAGKRNI